MGFAGQVFAARVAVGLAMPSPKAFSQAGQMIGGFASRMYGNLRRQNVEAAKKSLGTSTANLKQARSNLENHSKNQDKFLEKSAKGAVQRLKNAYKGLGASATASAGAMKALKRAAPKSVKTKLFANIGKDMADGKKFEQMLMNFTKLRKEERREVMEGVKIQRQALQNTINTSAKREKLGEEAVQLIKDEIAVIKSQEEEYKHFDNVRTTGDTKYAKTKQDLSKKVVDADKDVTKAEQELVRVQQDVAKTQAFIQEGTHSLAVAMKTNFVEAVRESISVLTAFYYKLQENTQELIQFERELLNANSVFRVTNEELFSVGDQVVQFGQQFGMEMQNGAEGLYQLASAGLSASDSMQVLNETLKLSMAVAGDHNTISKLVTQTLFGFDMEMNQAAEVTDKFAFAIQKSLIEYQDLASAVKFALPFFTSTGQSIDQLLGSLQILTNRALEAGIAGRGLRQGVAELAESIGDSTANFKQMGVEVTDAQGNMLQLTEIATNFSKVLGAGVINDTELLTTLIQDLNVRGATAFVHLVQNAEEFKDAVDATAGAGGELDEMVRIQNESIQAQIQILKNNLSMMFLYNDAAFEGTGYLNAFHQAISETVQDFQELLVVQTESGYVLTEFGKNIQEVAIRGVYELRAIMNDLIPLIMGFVDNMALSLKLLEVYLLPLKILVGAMKFFGEDVVKAALAFHLMNKILPISTAIGYAYQLMALRGVAVTEAMIVATSKNTLFTQAHTAALITKFALEKAITSFRMMVALPATQAYVAAESYSATLQALGIVLDEKEMKSMTRKTFLRHLDTAGIKYNADAIAYKEAGQVGEILLSEASILVQMRLTLTRYRAAAANWWQNFSIMALINSTILLIGNKIWDMMTTIADTAYTTINTVAKWHQNLIQTILTYNKGLGVLAALALGVALIFETIAIMAATLAAWGLAIPLGIIAAITSPLWGTIVGITLAFVALGLVLYGVGKRMEEQFGLWFRLKEFFGNFIGFIKWGIGVWVGEFAKVGTMVIDIMEGPLFKMGLWFSHFFKMLGWYIKNWKDLFVDLFMNTIPEAIMGVGVWIDKWIVQPIKSVFSGMADLVVGLTNSVIQLAADIGRAVKEKFLDVINRGIDAVMRILNLGKSISSNTIKIIKKAIGLKNGGYVTAMANGGQAQQAAPYIVGEVGPELFVPQTAGKVIPNKDLNSKRVDKMLHNALKGIFKGDKEKGMVVQNLTVESLDVGSFNAGSAALAIDSFAGKAISKKASRAKELLKRYGI